MSHPPCDSHRASGETVIALSFIETDGGTEIVLALAAISAYLKQQIPDVTIRLLPIHPKWSQQDQTPEGFAARVAESGAEVVGISCLSVDWFALDPYLKALHEQVPNVLVVLGGYQAILSPEETMAHPGVDFICLADGEKPMADLVRRLRGEHTGAIGGMWERLEDGSILKREPVFTQDLSKMPYPDYSIFEQTGALKGRGMDMTQRFTMPVMTGRGCPYRCSYCSNTPMLKLWRGQGNYLRKYDIDTLMRELKNLRDRYGVEYFEFWDELFLFDVAFAHEFLARYREEIHLPFSINSRVEKMDEAFCRLAAEAGCDMIWFGIESGSESYRRTRLNRKMTNTQILEAAENCRKFGIRRITFNMVGMPFERKEDMLMTLELNRLIQPEFFFFLMYIPLRGTPLYDLAAAHDLVPERYSSDFQEGARTGRYVANLLPHAGFPTPEELQAVCERMRSFQLGTEASRHFKTPDRAAEAGQND